MSKKPAKEPKPKVEKPQDEPVIASEQPFAAISDIKKYVEEESIGVNHRELSMAYKGMIEALTVVEGWVKNIQDVEADIANKIKK